MGLEPTTFCWQTGRGFGPSDAQTRMAMRFLASPDISTTHLKHADLRAIPADLGTGLRLVPIEFFANAHEEVPIMGRI